MPAFVYQPLIRDRREIRLIVLEDSKDSADVLSLSASSLKCKLITTSLDFYQTANRTQSLSRIGQNRQTSIKPSGDEQLNSEHFYAISYVWGDQAAVCCIEINGIPCKIGSNLHAALTSILENTKFRFLWADALCIDQKDKDEKSWQVQQMAAIYSRARGTISWLGSASSDSDLALRTLSDLDRAIDRASQRLPESGDGRLPQCKIKQKAIEIYFNAASWTAIAKLCDRPYWTRIWIFQEMSCASDRYFICGDFVANGIDRPLAYLLIWKNKHENTSSTAFNSQFLAMIDSVQRFRYTGYLRANTPNHLLPDVLFEMLVKLNVLEATNVRDKVYAPLALANDHDKLGLVPNYSKSVESIMIETACALLRTGSLGTILLAMMQDKTLCLPSWVPDWSVNICEGFHPLCRADYGQFQRPATLSAIPQLSDHITLDGYVAGEIIWIHDACPTAAVLSAKTQTMDLSQKLAKWLYRFENAVKHTYIPESDNGTRETGCKSYESIIVELLDAVGGRWSEWSLSSDPHSPNHVPLKKATSLPGFLQDLADYKSHLRDPCLMNPVTRIWQRLECGFRPHVLQSGAIGISWKGREQVHDLVVIFPGVRIPCILRRFTYLEVTGEALSASEAVGLKPTDSYQLIDMTYIHGIMSGEFFRQEEHQLQSFTLY